MYHTLIFLLLGSALLTASAEQPVVSNVRAEQRAYPSHLVDIWYDVSDAEGDELYVSVLVSETGGGSWTVPAQTLSGHVGSGVLQGSNRHIVWDAGADAPSLEESDMKVRVTAWDYGLAGDLTLIPSGSFVMGSAAIGGNSVPEHTVNLTRNFYLGTTEVTNQQYLEALQWAYDNSGLTGVSATSSTVTAYGQELLDLDENRYCEIAFNSGTGQFYLVARTYNQGSWGPGFVYPSGYDPALHPVKEVSWYGAACYCDWRSLMEGLPAFYQGSWNQHVSHDPYTASGYRLPTEAEWEFAAQWEDERVYPWGNQAPNCNRANFLPSGDNSCVGWTAPVGNYPAGMSQRGLSDMAGNLWEWTGDWWGSYSSGTQNDPYGPASGSGRVIRGGGWYNDESYLPCAGRTPYAPSYTNHGVGIRLCRTAN